VTYSRFCNGRKRKWEDPFTGHHAHQAARRLSGEAGDGGRGLPRAADPGKVASESQGLSLLIHCDVRKVERQF